MDNREAIR